MKILVTGCAGFIGLNFVNYWLKNHADDIIVGVDCFTYASNKKETKILVKSKKIQFYKKDISKENSMRKVFQKERPDVVINFAAESHVDRSIISSKPFVKSNVFGVRVLLDLCLEFGIKRFHQISTDEVYGDVDFNKNARFNEDSLLRPSSPYSASKAAADLLCLSYFNTHGLPVTISRSSNNFGPYQHEEKLIPKTIKNALANERIPIYGNGQNVRDWIDVNEHCRAIDLILNSNKVGEIYNICSGVEISNIELVKILLKKLGKSEDLIEFVADRKGHDRRYSISSNKIKNQLNFECKLDFDNLMQETIEWFTKKYNI